MKLFSKNLAALLAVLLLAVFLLSGTSFDAIKQWLTGGDAASAEAETAAEKAPSSVDKELSIRIPVITQQLALDEVRLLIASFSVEQQRQLLSDPQVFASYIQQQLVQKSLLGLILADDIATQPLVELLMKRSAENALVEWYLGQLIQKNLPTDFPLDEQIQAFYAENQATFVIDERVHLWQIFLPVAESASDEQLLQRQAEADTIRDDILAGRLSFAEAALQFSQHSPSRDNGGYVGLIELEDLPPAIQASARQLQENAISEPLKTANGLHIIRRGKLVAEQTVELPQIRSKIVEVMRQKKTEDIKRLLLERARQEFPSAMTEQDIEEWRLKLRSGL